MGEHSLRRRLLTLLLSALVTAWGVMTLLAYLRAHEELDELLDAHLARAASLLIAQAGDELEEIRLEPLEDVGPYAHALSLQVWRDDGKLVLRTPDAPASRLSAVESGFSDSTVDGRNWRVYSGRDRSAGYLVQVAEDHAAREQLLRHYALSSIPVLLVALPILGLIISLTIGAAVRPLAQLGDEVGRRGPADLDALPTGNAPIEVRPLIDRLNELFLRIRESLLAERRFTSHAAHELRTPIAAIRAHAEVARSETSPGGRDAALDHVIEGCDRAARLVDQMLMLARLDEQLPTGVLPSARLDRVAAEVLADMAPAALGKGVGLELDVAEPLTVAVHPALLAVLLRNLVDNAIRHGGPPGPVTVRCALREGSAWLEVEDQGPGVPAAELAELGRRFYRASGSRGPGSGLGLSIVRRIADAGGAKVSCRTGAGGRGLLVAVEFPSSWAGSTA
jgi:two-component system sensor histidine kinase QseC